jgi:two-component system, LytTR family, response regulator
MIKIVVVENDPPSIDTIEETLNSFCKGVEIVCVVNDIYSGIQKINEISPELIILDNDFFNDTNTPLLLNPNNKISDCFYILTFSHTIQLGGNLNILACLQKPIEPSELVSSVFKAYNQVGKGKSRFVDNNENTQNLYKQVKNDKLVLRTSDSIYPVNINEIIRCESGGSYTYFYLNNKRKITVSKSLREFEELLKKHNFFRVHQSHLININYIDRFDKRQGGEIFLKDGASVPVSFRRKDKLLKIFEEL